MNNIIDNVKDGATMDKYRNVSGYDLARTIAEGHAIKNNVKTAVVRICDYIDRYEGNDRHHYSFDVIEVIE
jgi:hypothetical protein